MDGARFDDLTRRLAVALSRRGVLRLLGGSLAGAVSTTLMPVRPARGQVLPPWGREKFIIKELFGEDLEDLQSVAFRDEHLQQLLEYTRKVLGLYPGRSTAWVTAIDLTRCAIFLRTVLVTPAGEEAASLDWVKVERPGEGVITIRYLKAGLAFYAVTNGQVNRISTDTAGMPWPQIRRVCETACRLVREGRDGQAPCDVLVPLMELCISKISGARQVALLTLAVKTVCTAMRLGCAPGDCVACDPPCGPGQRCLESGSAGPRCCQCRSNDGKCCVDPAGTVWNECVTPGCTCGYPFWPKYDTPACVLMPNVQCLPPTVCTN